MHSLSGQVAIVTGAGHPKGIGRAIATKLASQGASLVIVDREGAEGLDTAVADLQELALNSAAATENKHIAIGCDVTDADAVKMCVQQVVDTFGRIDVMVNNAGVGRGSADFLQLTELDWSLSLQVNVQGVANFSQAVLPAMLEKGEGNIINIASLAGLGAIESIPACYTASKFAVIGLTKQLAVNYAGQGIRCNAVCPGSVVTQMHQHSLQLLAEEHGISLDEAQALEDANIPVGYSAAPEQIADAVAYLASPAASYITGINLPVAGGMSPGL